MFLPRQPSPTLTQRRARSSYIFLNLTRFSRFTYLPRQLSPPWRSCTGAQGNRTGFYATLVTWSVMRTWESRSCGKAFLDVTATGRRQMWTIFGAGGRAVCAVTSGSDR
ncbi:hypothetical protein CC85DRAFT_177881 [Cutaneotrichosporon oleaginosum]|uniref:Uncharacterized protein n=1 Tax=Cutaneotrichosporon oleaginosum TaxID=879819 RepID=A0A0J0XFG5_9TREE|nr:uncharacterized protein CC85DRAFT_177881 [Cutaneotrichosporon oleaginosum]KLT39835.1 hypothetical protein CC85DRAFT_177881 [Cutaneotrichosporon oleaginosum]TXT10359.1 hypothetical protein COLE_04293 [Cutaneotrichosporon oleaginosum]